MATFLVNLEIVVEEEHLLMSEVETAMHKMLKAVKTYVNISDYGLDMECID